MDILLSICYCTVTSMLLTTDSVYIVYCSRLSIDNSLYSHKEYYSTETLTNVLKMEYKSIRHLTYQFRTPIRTLENSVKQTTKTHSLSAKVTQEFLLL